MSKLRRYFKHHSLCSCFNAEHAGQSNHNGVCVCEQSVSSCPCMGSGSRCRKPEPHIQSEHPHLKHDNEKYQTAYTRAEEVEDAEEDESRI